MKFLTITMAMIGCMLLSVTGQARTNPIDCNGFIHCMNAQQQLTPKRYSGYYAYSYKKKRRHYFKRFPKRIVPPGRRLFVFSPRLKRWAAYDENGHLQASGKANGGANWCNDVGRPCRTPRGVFSVHTKGTASCVSRKYPIGKGGAPMPYCMYFRGGYAIHGSPYISDRNTSHGCIRVETSWASWLHKKFINVGTRVVVLPY